MIKEPTSQTRAYVATLPNDRTYQPPRKHPRLQELHQRQPPRVPVHMVSSGREPLLRNRMVKRNGELMPQIRLNNVNPRNRPGGDGLPREGTSIRAVYDAVPIGEGPQDGLGYREVGHRIEEATGQEIAPNTINACLISLNRRDLVVSDHAERGRKYWRLK